MKNSLLSNLFHPQNAHRYSEMTTAFYNINASRTRWLTEACLHDENKTLKEITEKQNLREEFD